jgi:hypothetical protein
MLATAGAAVAAASALSISLLAGRGLDRALRSKRENWAAVGLCYAALLLGWLIGLIALARAGDWDDEVVFVTGLGVTLALLTALRPRIFWDHARAVALRGLLGDRLTALVYGAVAVTLLAFGIRRAQLLDEAIRTCQARLAGAVDSHSRVRALHSVPGGWLPAITTAGTWTCERYLAAERR